MWPPIYQCFESHSCLYTEFTVAGEEKCMLNSASANTVQGIQGACTTSPSFSKIQKCIHTLDKSRQSITGHSNWFIQNRPLPVQSERIPRYKLSLSSFIPASHLFPAISVPRSREEMEWNQWLKCVILYRSFIVYKGVEGEGRG